MTGISGYEAWLRARSLSQNTIHQRVRFADRRWHKWGTWERSPDQLATFLDRHTGWTRATYYAHLLSIYEWRVEAGLSERNPMREVRRLSPPRPRPRPLSPGEVNTVMASDADPRTRAMMSLALLAGLRSHEVAKFHGRDVDETSLYVYGKGGQGAAIPTHPALWELAQSFPRNGYWFPSTQRGRPHVSASLVGQVVAARFRECGITYGSIHRLRASYGTALLHGGATLRVIQDLMRHASLSSTEHYLGVTEAEKRAAIAGLAS